MADYQGNSLAGIGGAGALGYAGMQSQVNACPKPETLPMLLDEIEKLAYSLKEGAVIAADNLSGGLPEPKNPENENIGTILGKARSIRTVLRSAADHQRRTLNALAL